jgi:hypothetical protein
MPEDRKYAILFAATTGRTETNGARLGQAKAERIAVVENAISQQRSSWIG